MDQTTSFGPEFLKRYRITRTLGEGGMGRVYEGVHLALDRRVAVKVLKETDPVEIARFEREARMLATLKHPQILQVYETGTEKGVPYLVCELVEGSTLRERMTTPLPLEQILEIGTGLARALAFAHERNIIHRDVKPENVFVLEGTAVKLGDFGLARSTTAGATVTGAGMVMGSPSYMAPEQLRGDVTSRSIDQFSLGVILYEMLVNRLPFVAADASQSLVMRLHKEAPPLGELRPDLPRPLTRLVTRMLLRDKTERFESMEAVASALEEVAGRAPAPAPPPDARTQSSRIAIPQTSATRSARIVVAPPDSSGPSAPAAARRVPIVLAIVALPTLAGLLGFLAGRRTTEVAVPVATPTPVPVRASLELTKSHYLLKIVHDGGADGFLEGSDRWGPVRRALPPGASLDVPLDEGLRFAEDLTVTLPGKQPIPLGPLFEPQAADLVARLKKIPLAKVDSPDSLPAGMRGILDRAAPILPSWLVSTRAHETRLDLLNILYQLEAIDNGVIEMGKPTPASASDLLPGRWLETLHLPPTRESILQRHGPTRVKPTSFPMMFDGAPKGESDLWEDPRWNHIQMVLGTTCNNPMVEGEDPPKPENGPNSRLIEFTLDDRLLEGVHEMRLGIIASDRGNSVIVIEINDRLTLRFSYPGIDMDKFPRPPIGRTRGLPAGCFRPGPNKIVLRIEYCPVRSKSELVYFDSMLLTFYRGAAPAQ